MSLSELQKYTYVSKYARWLPEKKRRATWNEATDLVLDMHLQKYPQIEEELRWAFDQVRKKIVLGSQRGLQFAGDAIFKHNARLFNCSVLYLDRLRAFQESMYLLLCGCVPSDTKVLTENGIKQIGEVSIGDKVYSYNIHKDKYELKKVLLTHDVPVDKDEIIKVSCRYGSFITTSKHPVLVRRDGVWNYIPTDSIKVGDIVNKYISNSPNVEFNKEGYFTGAFLGDGCSNLTEIASRRIRINGDNQAVITRFAEIGTKLSGENFDAQPDVRSDYSVKMWKCEKTISKNNELSKKWITLVGNLPSKKTKIIRIPEWIKQSFDKNIFFSFLAGLIDTDGCCYEQKISISTSSKLLVDDLLEYCPIHGVYPYVTEISVDSYSSIGFKPTSTMYRITFPKLDFKLYTSFFAHDKKRESIEEYITSPKAQHKTLVIPEDLIDNEAEYLNLDSSKRWHFRQQIENNGTCYASYYVSRNKSFDNLIQFDQVINIEYIGEHDQVFKDLTVEDNNSYLVGDGSYYVLHNCGVGFSAQTHHVDLLPELTSPGKKIEVYSIPDAIEGWADSIGVLLSSYVKSKDSLFPRYSYQTVEFDYSQIRPKGSRLGSGNGKAPGPEPLRLALERVRILLDSCLERGKLRPIDAYDIVMHSSDAVLSGGVRRSATICLFSPTDKEMINAKIGDWFYTNPQRGRSNNSALLVRGKVSWEEFSDLILSVRHFGEPGFVWTNSEKVVLNPCGEIEMIPADEFGNSGVQFCNLCEINGKKLVDQSSFEIAARAAAIIGTAQAGYTSFPYLGEVTERITKREALLGVSITGMMDSPEITLNPAIQREMAEVVKNTNAEIANKIGINLSARTTAIKPAGTTSCILGTSSGIHPHHAKRYFRRVQDNDMLAPLRYFQSINPLAVANSVWSANQTDKVITFCVDVPPGSKIKNELSAVELLDLVKLTRANWIEYGTRPECCVDPKLRHNVSNTITVKPDEWNAVAKKIFDDQNYYSGVSLLPFSGDKDYPQAPFCAIFNPKEITSYYGDGSLFASGLIEFGLGSFSNNLWAACDVALGLKEPDGGNQKKWKVSALKFAERYFEGDVRRMTYCLKDVHNWKLWVDLKREYKEVDYTNCLEEEDDTSLLEVIACAGSKCDL